MKANLKSPNPNIQKRETGKVRLTMACLEFLDSDFRDLEPRGDVDG